MDTATPVDNLRKGHVGTALLYLAVLCSDLGCMHNLLGDIVNHIFKLPAINDFFNLPGTCRNHQIKMAVQACYSCPYSIQFLEEPCSALLSVPASMDTYSHLRCIIVPTALNTTD